MGEVKRRQSDKDILVIIDRLEVIKDDIVEIKQSVKDIKTEVKECYVSKIEFEPIKKLVYGAVGLILAAVIGAIITLVVRS